MAENRHHRLPRRRMLKHKLDIRGVLERGRRIKGKTINIYLKTADCTQFAVLVPRRLGKAYQRNHMKRLAREIYRQHPEWFENKQTIFFVKRYNDNYAGLEREVHQLVNTK